MGWLGDVTIGLGVSLVVGGPGYLRFVRVDWPTRADPPVLALATTTTRVLRKGSLNGVPLPGLRRVAGP